MSEPAFTPEAVMREALEQIELISTNHGGWFEIDAWKWGQMMGGAAFKALETVRALPLTDTRSDIIRELGISREQLTAFEDFLNEPQRTGRDESPELRDYRHEAYRLWEPICRVLTAKVKP
jgi:hypothetical protein